MQLRVTQPMLRRAQSRIPGPLALAVGAMLLGSAGATLGNGEAPAVWVPAAPGAAEADQPFVLVPYAQSLATAEFGQDFQPQIFQPWVPNYLAAPVARGAATPPPGAESEPEATAAVPLSQVLRAAHWRRDTAQRLRAQPEFEPRF